MKKIKILIICLMLVIILSTFISFNEIRNKPEVKYSWLDGYLDDFILALDINIDDYEVLEYSNALDYIDEMLDDTDERDSLFESYNEAYHGTNHLIVSPVATLVHKNQSSVLVIFETDENKIVGVTILKGNNWKNYKVKEYDDISFAPGVRLNVN